MAIPTAILKIIFVIAAACFAMLIGSVLGATIFGDHGAHGMAGIINILVGAGIGTVAGAVVALVLIFKYHLSGYALKLSTFVSAVGALLTFLLIQILDSYDMW